MRFWADTDFLLRLVTKVPDDLFRRALAVVEEAEAGHVALAVHPIHVAEANYLLRSLYRYSREEVRDELGIVLHLKALEVYDGDRVNRALALTVEKNVDFDDAYLALWAADRDEGVVSFDRDFARLPANWREP